MLVRPYVPGDAPAIVRVVHRALREVNSRDYPPERIREMCDFYCAEQIVRNATLGHLYVACEGACILGSGAIKPMEAPGEYEIATLFILPDRRGEGIGSAIMAALERDPLFLGASRVFVSASLSANGFYEKLGYTYEEGRPVIHNADNYHMEKFPL